MYKCENKIWRFCQNPPFRQIELHNKFSRHGKHEGDDVNYSSWYTVTSATLTR